jgi:hypothetical protein
MTRMRRPLPGAHTPVAAVGHVAGGGRRHSIIIGGRGEAAVQRVASCSITDCHLASRPPPSRPSGDLGGPVRPPPAPQRVPEIPVPAAGAPVSSFPKVEAPRANGRRAHASVAILMAGSPVASPQHDVVPQPHIAPGSSRSSMHHIPTSPQVVVAVVAGTPMLVQLAATQDPFRAPRGFAPEKEEGENSDKEDMQEARLESIPSPSRDPLAPPFLQVPLPTQRRWAWQCLRRRGQRRLCLQGLFWP